MAINTTCPACRKTYRVPGDQEGKRVQCLECREGFVVNGESDRIDRRELSRKSSHDDRDERGINTSCPACRKAYCVPADQEGKRVQCQECRESFVVKGKSSRDNDLPVLREASRKDSRDDRDEPRSRPRDDEDEFEDDVEPAPARGGYTLIFVFAGVFLLLLLGGGGVMIWALTRSDPVVVNDPPPQEPDDPIKKDNDKPVPPPPVEKDVAPRDVTAALEAIRHPQTTKKRQGIEFLLAAPVEVNKRDQVERALEPYEDDHQLGDLAARALKHWAPENEVPRQIRRLSSDRFGVADAAMEALSKSNDDRAVSALASQLEVTFREDKAAKHLEAVGQRCEKDVLAYLNHPRPGTRRAARQVLDSIGTSKEVLMQRCLLDVGGAKEGDVTQRGQRADAAFEMLATMTPGKDEGQNAKVAKVFEEAALTEKGSRARTALDALEKWATKENVPALIELSKQKLQTERVYKILLKFTDDERLIPLFVSALADPNHREVGVKALKGFGEKSEDYLLPLLEPTHRSAEARGLAVLLVAEFGTAKSVGGLTRLHASIPVRNKDEKKLVQAIIDRIKEREKAKKDKDAPKPKDKDAPKGKDKDAPKSKDKDS